MRIVGVGVCQQRPDYLDEIGELIGEGRPDPAAIAEVRARHDIEQLTPMTVRG